MTPEEQYIADLREVLKTNHGKNVIWNILGLTDLYIDHGPEGVDYYRGKRSIGLDLLEAIHEVDSTAYARLILHFAKIDDGKGNQ